MEWVYFYKLSIKDSDFSESQSSTSFSKDISPKLKEVFLISFELNSKGSSLKTSDVIFDHFGEMKASAFKKELDHSIIEYIFQNFDSVTCIEIIKKAIKTN